MELTATIREGWMSFRTISINVPIISSPLTPIPLVDSRWARPTVFRDIFRYPLAETTDAVNDFNRIVDFVNASTKPITIDRYKDGLLKIVDEHIARCERILFCDLLMYVDCLSYLYYASDIMTEEQIVVNYPSWIKSIVDKRKTYVLCSTRLGILNYSGSENEKDLNSSLNNIET